MTKLARFRLGRPGAYGNRSPARTAWLGAGVVGGTLALDTLSQLLFWRPSRTEVIANQTNGARWLAIPGLGKSSGRFMREALADDIPGKVDYLQLSTRGISAKKVGQALARYFQTYYSATPDKHQNVLVHSLGLPTFLMGVEWCRRHRITVPPLGVLLAFSSPINPAHTYHERFIREVGRLPYPGGVISKLGIEFFQRSQAQRFRPATLSKAALDALKCSYTDCAPALWASQLRTLAHRDLYQPETFRGIIRSETKIVHFGDPADTIVNIPAARRDFAHFVRQCGADLVVVEVPGSGHANLSAVRRQLASSGLVA